MTNRINITLEHNVTSWTHRVGIAAGELVYQSPECNVYYNKLCKCSRAKIEDIAYQACLATQGAGLRAGQLRGVK